MSDARTWKLDNLTDLQQQQPSEAFERERVGQQSVLVSNWPDPYSTMTPTIGTDNFAQWFSPVYVFAIYILMEIFAMTFFSFSMAVAIWTFPGSFSLSLLIRSVVIGGTTYFIVLSWSRWTGSLLDGPSLILVGFCEMFFSRKAKPMTSAGFLARVSAIGKVFFFLLAQFIGALIGVAMRSTLDGSGIKTSDCNVDYVPACDMRPYISTTDSGAMWSYFWGYLLIIGSYFIAYSNKRISLWVALITKEFLPSKKYVAPQVTNSSGTDDSGSAYISISDPNSTPHVHTSNKKYVPWHINDEWHEVAKTVASGQFVAHLMFSSFVGSAGFNLMFYLAVGIYANDFSTAKYCGWAGFAAGATIFVIQTIWYLLNSGSANYTSTTLKELDKRL